MVKPSQTEVVEEQTFWTKPGAVPPLNTIKEKHSDSDGSQDAKTFTILDTTVPTGQTAMILGSSYTGKTTLLVHGLRNMLKEKAYDAVVIFTESPNAEPLKGLPNSNRIAISQGYFPNLVRLMYKINAACDNRFRFLTILDDIVDMKANKTFLKQILTYRNSNISTCVLTQYAKLVPPSHRGSFHNVYFTGGGSSMELKEFIVKNWLNGYIRNRLGVPPGCSKRGLLTLLNEWFERETAKGDNGTEGKYLWLQTIKEDLSVQKRPPAIN